MALSPPCDTGGFVIDGFKASLKSARSCVDEADPGREQCCEQSVCLRTVEAPQPLSCNTKRDALEEGLKAV